MKIEEAKKLQNVFKLSLNEISKGRHESEEQESELKISNCFTNHQKLLLNYLMIIFQLYMKLTHNKTLKRSRNVNS